MYNAAIIIFRRSTLPRMLKFFVVPKKSQEIEVGNGEKLVRVHIIECPVMKEPADNRKVAGALKELCRENNILFFIGKHNEYYWDSGLERLENIVERGNIHEINAIKHLAALIKISGDRDKNLLKKYMCFVGESYSIRYISTASEEAAGVFIYEHDKMDSRLKKTLFEGLMAEKGISAVFSKDLKKIIAQSDIILADESVELEDHRSELAGKILLGNNPVTGSFEKVSQVLLWYESLEGTAHDNILIRLNDELLSVLRHFYKERSSIGFIRRFPYIYMSRIVS